MDHSIVIRVTICAIERQSEGHFYQTSDFLFIRWFFQVIEFHWVMQQIFRGNTILPNVTPAKHSWYIESWWEMKWNKMKNVVNHKKRSATNVSTMSYSDSISSKLAFLQFFSVVAFWGILVEFQFAVSSILKPEPGILTYY